MENINQLRKTVRQQPDLIDNRLKLTRLLIDAGRTGEALEHYNAAKQSVKSGSDHLALGRLARSLGFSENAESHFKNALQRMPDDLESLIALAQLYIYRGWITHAMSTHNKIVLQDPENRIAESCKQEIIRVLQSCNLDLKELADRNTAGIQLCYPDIAFETLMDLVLENYPLKYQPVSNRYAVVLYQLRLGGIQKKVSNLIRALKSRTNEVENIELFCQSISRLEGDAFLLPGLRNNGIEVKEYYPPGAENFSFDHKQITEYASILVAMGEEGVKIAHLMLALIDYRPEIVHGFGYQCVEFGIAAALAGVPRIILHSGNLRPGTMSTSDYWQDHSRWVGHAYRALSRLPNVIFTNNCHNATWDFTRWLGLPPGQIQTIYNGVDFESLGVIDRDQSGKYRESLGIPDDCFIVGSAFRFTEQKQPFLWLNVARLLTRHRPDIHFVILGEGPLFNSFKEKLGEVKIRNRVHLPGLVSNMTDWYGLMDVVLLTSGMEGTSNVAIEAQWYGIPVVSTNVGGMNETLLHGQSGWLVHPARPELLAEQILWVLDHTDWCKDAAGIGHDFVKNQFNMKKMVKRILSFNNNAI